MPDAGYKVNEHWIFFLSFFLPNSTLGQFSGDKTVSSSPRTKITQLSFLKKKKERKKKQREISSC